MLIRRQPGPNWSGPEVGAAAVIEVLERSAASVDGGTAFDHFFLCMACRELGEEDRARAWFDRGLHAAGEAQAIRSEHWLTNKNTNAFV